VTTSTPDTRTSGTATHREIRQQPASWQRAAADLAERRADLDAFLRPVLATEGLRIVLTGAGTSAFVGDIAAETLRRHLRRRVDSVATTDLVADPTGALGEGGPVLLVSFARSGNSPESVAATRVVDDFSTSAAHLVITCDAEGDLAVEHAADPRSFVLTMPPETNDTGFAMTSSFSSMLLAACCGRNRSRRRPSRRSSRPSGRCSTRRPGSPRSRRAPSAWCTWAAGPWPAWRRSPP
jgi:tagatose-6-phosphate ketose/aldose isomerase